MRRSSTRQALDEPGFCEGTVRIAERLAIMLPDGDLAAADEPNFIEWLLEHGEPAPFGHYKLAALEVTRDSVRG